MESRYGLKKREGKIVSCFIGFAAKLMPLKFVKQFFLCSSIIEQLSRKSIIWLMFMSYSLIPLQEHESLYQVVSKRKSLIFIEKKGEILGNKELM